MRRQLSALMVAVLMVSLLGYASYAMPTADSSATETAGKLLATTGGGAQLGVCPLERTDVNGEISGGVARVTVVQHFRNPFREPIDATYVFPLPRNAAVDRMVMRIGSRTVEGRIARREEARAIYDGARAAGQAASLLDQERPNVFMQSVANIPPGKAVDVTISYVEVLKYDDGAYRFVFPMVVGPRYVPGGVPDASRITPPSRGRSGHDLTLQLSVDAGMPIKGLRSELHEIDVHEQSPSRAIVRLKYGATIPNRDFILAYEVAGDEIGDAILTHRGDGGDGYFTLLLQPPSRVAPEEATPKELVFVVDTSGSMEGFPIEKAKETIDLALASLNPRDTFNLITFAGDTRILFDDPVPATAENVAEARRFLASRSGSGGTEMMKAIRAALGPSDAADHMRVVCFATDGYVGDDFAIIGEVQRHPDARVFSFGVGNSVNRFLLDEMAREGRGDVEYVTLESDGSAAARRLYERVRSPLLTDVSVDWGELNVEDVYPRRIPDVFSAKPVVICGRYTQPGKGTIRLRGLLSGRPFEREISVELPQREDGHDVLGKIWARERIDELMRRDYEGMQNGVPNAEVREAVTALGLEFGLMTQFTSFVAVEERVVTEGGVARRVEVPVEPPAGTGFGAEYGGPQAQTEDFTIWGMMQKMSWEVRIVRMLLVMMGLCVTAIVVRKLFLFRTTRKAPKTSG
jgi:Ca-activated chloride channel homolog